MKKQKQYMSNKVDNAKLVRDTARMVFGDAYINPMLSQGTASDPVNSVEYVPNRRRTWDMLSLNQVERSSAIVRKICNFKATMPLKKGFDIKSDKIEPERIANLQECIARLLNSLEQIIYQGEIYGGSAGLIYIKGQDGLKSLVKPLDIKKVKKGDFYGIKPLERWFSCTPTNELVTELGETTGIYDANLLGEPLYFNIRLTPSQNPIKVHRTRLLFYNTGLLPSIEKKIEQYWGVSIVERIWDSLYRYETMANEIVRAVNGLNIRVIKMSDLLGGEIGNVSNNTKELLEAKMQAIKIGLNQANILFLTDEDEFDYKTATLTNLDSLFTTYKIDLANNSGVPYTYLFGDGTLTSQINENELEGIKDIQDIFIRKWFEILLPIIYRNLYEEDIPEYNLRFKKIRETSEKEVAEVIEKVGTVVLDAYKEGAMNKKALIYSLREIANNTSDVFNNIEEEYVNKVGEETHSDDQVRLASALNKPQVVSGEEKFGGENQEKKPTPRVEVENK